MRVERIQDATLYLGDCLEILPTLGPVDAVVTDPPYGLNYPYLSYDDTPENLLSLIAGWLPAARAIAKRVVVFPGVHNLTRYPEPTWTVSWSWRTTSHFGKAGYNMWQPVLLYGTDLPEFGNVNGLTKADSIHFADGNGVGFLGESVKDHPCPKPEKVMRWIIQRFSEANSTVTDPFMGSGTTGVACAKLGRKFIGIEIEPKYFDIACRRIENAYKQPDMFLDSRSKPKPVQETFLE
jgi:site-specific DNA-methyltransferase (adenine-specific)